MQSRVVTYQNGELTVKLTVVAASILVSVARSLLRTDASKALDANPDAPQAVRILHRWTYPDLIAATVAAEGIPWPLSFDDFAALPEELGDLWSRAVYELNPHWLGVEATPAEKKD
jgi:hypothetical protein